MARKIYCASCGNEVLLFPKAYNKQIVNFIEPHNCDETPKWEDLEAHLELKPYEKVVDLPMKFAESEVVKQLNELEKQFKPKLESDLENYGDRRPADQVKDGANLTTAPEGLLGIIKPAPPKQRPTNVSRGMMSTIPEDDV